MSNIKVDDEYESTNAMQRPQDIFNLNHAKCNQLMHESWTSLSL